MDFLTVAVLGIVEGVTEFLPVSSTAHLIIASKLLRLPDSDFVKSFTIAIQLGAILSVVTLYAKTLLRSLEIWKRIVVAFVPTGAIGFALYGVAKNYLLGNEWVAIAALATGGVLLILFELKHEEKEGGIADMESMPYGTAALIGVAQSVAIVPGVSRSAATIIGGLALGVRREAIVQFSFLLAIPTMLAATVLDLYKSLGSFSAAQAGWLSLGFVISFAVALLSVKFLIHYVKRHTFVAFGVYRIIAAAVLALVLYF